MSVGFRYCYLHQVDMACCSVFAQKFRISFQLLQIIEMRKDATNGALNRVLLLEDEYDRGSKNILINTISTHRIR